MRCCVTCLRDRHFVREKTTSNNETPFPRPLHLPTPAVESHWNRNHFISHPSFVFPASTVSSSRQKNSLNGPSFTIYVFRIGMTDLPPELASRENTVSRSTPDWIKRGPIIWLSHLRVERDLKLKLVGSYL